MSVKPIACSSRVSRMRSTVPGAYCPFLDYRVETVGDHVRWTIANPVTGDARGAADAILDSLYALPCGVAVIMYAR